MTSADRLRSFTQLVVFAAVLALPACVSEADPREGSQGPRDVRSGSDVSDADARDSARNDAQDGSVPEDSDDQSMDAVGERGIDAEGDSSARDGSDATSSPDATDVSTDPVGGDAITDVGTSDSDARIDAADAGTTGDVSDAGAPSDVIDAGVPGDASDALNDSDAGNADAPADVGDASDGGAIVFYQENFDTVLGTFSNPANVCGSASAQWTVVGGYAHAADPEVTVVSRITSQVVSVPLNMSNIRLRMSHKFDTEETFDAGTLLISINGAAAIQVTTFVSGGYTFGGQTNPTSCFLSNTPSLYPGWSGNHAEWESEVNLSAAPFNVIASNTVTITFRMATDATTAGNGWDINWVTLSGTSP